MILFLTDSAPDYGADYLFDGFARAFGITHVVDWPQKHSLHGEGGSFDCDLDWPGWAPMATSVRMWVEDLLSSGQFDLLVVPTLRGKVTEELRDWSQRGLLNKVRDCTVCYDAEDHTLNTKRHFVDALGYEPAAYFKRELPIGATWATPLPFGYPEERVVPPTNGGRYGVAYSAFLWSWVGDGLRAQIRDRLLAFVDSTEPRNAPVVAAYRALITATDDATKRVDVETDHQLHQRARVAVSPAGQGSTTNRHLQCIADGAAPIWERLTVEYPNAPHGGTECLYFDTADEAVTHVRTLLGDPAYAISMAQAAQKCLRQHHTTAVRARTVWGSVHSVPS